ncbi:hypothetical protein FO519_008943 [Halicephalobus sp. NKZ332]|nr:hypothetical protein FO519_008943 [Halicephalobus sp. NKZ332]
MNEKFGTTCRPIPIDNCHNDSTVYSIIEKFEYLPIWNHNCVVDLHPNGTKIVVLLGNSYASRFSFTAVEALKEFPSVKKMYFISRASCTIFDTLLRMEEPQWHCEEMLGKDMAFVKKVKPDIIINMSRYNHIVKFNVPIDEPDSLENDTVVLGIKNEISEYEKYTKKIIIFEPPPNPINSTFRGPGDIARILTFNRTSASLDSLASPRDAVERNLAPAWTRIRAAISDCKKCIVIPTLELFCGKTKCPVTENSGLSRYCDRSHLSKIGTNIMLPSLKSVLSGIL